MGELLASLPPPGPFLPAESAGFEPAVPFGTPDFESGTIGHSDSSPPRKVSKGPPSVKTKTSSSVAFSVDRNEGPNDRSTVTGRVTVRFWA